MPHVTVVVPNFNHARFLDQRIRSVLDQTYGDIEVILMDDCSTDGSAAILESYGNDPRVRLVFNERNSGSPFAQWNKGVSLAKGEYVWIAESDDYADLNLLATLVDRLDRHSNVGLAHADSWMVDETGATLGTYYSSAEVRQWIDADRWNQGFIAHGRTAAVEHLMVLNTIPSTSAVLFRKETFERAGGADETFLMAGDWLMWARMLAISDLAFVARKLNYWRQHPLTVRQRLFRSGLDVEEAFRATIQFQRLFHPTKAELEMPLRKLESFWYWRWRTLFPRISFRRSMRIYQLAQHLSPGLFGRVWRGLARRFRRM